MVQRDEKPSQSIMRVLGIDPGRLFP